MKSRVVVPAVYRNQLKKDTRATIVDELKDYKSRITDFMLAVFMLTAHEAWGIGAKRMAAIAALKSKANALTQQQQTDMIDMQTLVNRRDVAFSASSNIVRALGSSQSGNAGNF